MPQEIEEVVQTEVEPTETEVETTETPAAEDFKYELPDGSKHKTQEEALKHAMTLVQSKDIELAQANAYSQGVQDSFSRVPQAPNVTPQADPEATKAAWETEFYTNPQKVISDIKQQAISEAEQRISQRIGAKENETAIWNEFVGLHPDLSDYKTDVDTITDQHKEVVGALLKTKGKTAAMDYVAQKTRAKFDSYVEATKKRTELPRTKAGAPPPGQTNVTPTKKTEEPLDFASQMRKHKASRMGY